MDTLVKEHKLGFWDIFLLGWRVLFFKATDISLIALFAIVPLGLILALLSGNSLTEELRTSDLSISLFLVLLLLQAFSSLMFSMSLVVITEKVVEGQGITWSRAMKYALSKLGSVFTTSILMYLILIGLSLLFVIPGVIYSVHYNFALFVVVLKNKNGMEALAYSKKLVEGQWWRVFATLLGFGAINTIVGAVLNLFSSSPFFVILAIIISALFTIVSSTGMVILFLNSDFLYQRRLSKRIEMQKARKAKIASRSRHG